MFSEADAQAYHTHTIKKLHGPVQAVMIEAAQKSIEVNNSGPFAAAIMSLISGLHSNVEIFAAMSNVEAVKQLRQITNEGFERAIAIAELAELSGRKNA